LKVNGSKPQSRIRQRCSRPLGCLCTTSSFKMVIVPPVSEVASYSKLPACSDHAS